MPFWSRKKSREEQTEKQTQSKIEMLEAGTKEPFCARVIRQQPTTYNGVNVAGDIQPGKFRGLHSLDDLRDAITKVGGGGKYEARLYDDKVGGRPITTTMFTINGEPLLNGKTIADPSDSENAGPARKSGKKSQSEELPEDVKRLREEVQIEEEKHRLEAERIRHKRELEQLQGDEASSRSDDGLGMVMAKIAELEEARATERREFEERMAQQQRQFEERLEKERQEAERREERRRHDSEIAELRHQVQQALTGGNRGSDVSDMLKLMMAKSDETMKTILTIMTKTGEEKLNLATMQTDLLAKSFRDGLAAAAGRGGDDEDDQPKDLAGIVNAQLGKVIDLAGQYITQRGEKPRTITEAERAEMTRQITQSIMASQNERQIVRQTSAPPSAPQAPARSRPAPESPPPANPSDQIGRAVNKILRKLIRDSRAGRASADIFLADIQQNLPVSIQQELLAAYTTDANLIPAILKKYGDPKLVDEAWIAAQSVDSPEEESQPEVDGQPASPVSTE